MRYRTQYAIYLEAKYTRDYFDAIIVSDDNGINFLIQNGDRLFPSIPIVAVGINNLNIELGSLKDRTTVYYERDHISKNLELVQSLFPQTKNVYLLSDDSLTSQLIRRRFLNEAKNFPNLTIITISDKPLAEAALFLSKLPPKSVVFLTHYNTELQQGQYYDYASVASILSKNSSAPIFVFWEHYIGYGVLGGYINRSYSLGVQSILSLSHQLKFSLVDSVINYPTAWEGFVFEHGVFEKFKLEKEDLPYASSIVNKPSSFLYENRNIITVAALLIAMTLRMIIIQFIGIRRKKELKENKSHIFALQNKMLNVQREMIEVLGDAIETRSG